MQPARRRVGAAVSCRALLCAAALLVTLAAAAPLPLPLRRMMADNNITLWPEVLRISGVLDDVQAPPVRWAAFVPTDAAVRAFLQQMGLTMQGLEARPALARALIANHLVLGFTPAAQQELLAGKLKTVAPVAASSNTSDLRVVLNARGTPQQRLAVTDVQGQTALSVRILTVDANKVAVLTDKVLLSDHIYTTFSSLCQQQAKRAGLSCDLLARSGVLTAGLSSPDWPNTLFMPGNKGVAAAGLAATGSITSTAELRRVVEYHVLPGLHAIPDGLVNGSSYQTLLVGAKLKVEYGQGLPVSAAGALLDDGNATVTAFVVPADGQRVPVVVHNVFVGQGIVQGIPAVLLPPGWQRKASVGPPPSSAVGAGSGRRRRLSAFPEQVKVTQALNSAETAIRNKVRSSFRDDEARWA